jgi:SAM-dependent methyltransferase
MHLDFYRQNARYAESLRAGDPRKFQSLPRWSAHRPFHEKYVRALAGEQRPGAAILDVGCGVGQVVQMLASAGFVAQGVEVNEANLAAAVTDAKHLQLYDGSHLPFADQTFVAVGAFNVLEHVTYPVALLDEMTRVLQPGGRMVISSPNFLRVIGWRDYHPHMRGLRQKAGNAAILWRHLRAPCNEIRFEPMTPFPREPMWPDDDAVVATNALDFVRYFQSRNFHRIRVSCVDRPMPRWAELLLDATPLRFIMLNSFVTAVKPTGDQR